MARRSATDWAAILEVCRATNLANAEALSSGRTLLLRIVTMLTAMVLRLNDPGSGSTSLGTSLRGAVLKERAVPPRIGVGAQGVPSRRGHNTPPGWPANADQSLVCVVDSGLSILLCSMHAEPSSGPAIERCLEA